MTDVRIAARAAELADQFWAEVEAHLTWQIVQCRAGLPTQRCMPDQPRRHDDAPWRSWSPYLADAAAPLNNTHTPSSMLEGDVSCTTG